MTNLITHTVLCKHLGENATTPHTPVKAYVEGEVDLTQTVSRCANADWDMLVEINLYEVHEINLPEWLSLEEYLQARTPWLWLWNVYGVAKDTDENIQRNFLVLAHTDKVLAYALGKMTRTTLRSEFRLSLFRQAMEWLTQEPRTQKFQSPLSPKQAGSLINGFVSRDHKRDSEAFYYRLRYNFVA